MQGVGFYLREHLRIDGFNNDDYSAEAEGGTGRVTSDGTWEYKPPCNFDVPLELNVKFLESGSHKKGILSSKASGEPPLVLSTSVFAAVRHAIAAARTENTYFRLDAPATVDRIQVACGASKKLSLS